ncbi:MAG: DUF6941 family protein [Capsulimonadaceae bacterium]
MSPVSQIMSTKQNHVDLLLACDHFLADHRNKPSYIGVFSTIQPVSYPTTLARFYLVVKLLNTSISSTALRIVTSSGIEILDQTFMLAVGADGTAGVVVQFEGFAFSAPGEYTFQVIGPDKVVLGSTLITALPLKV